ncbi:hypothetical protein SUGI_0759380 [Cryptomeria japonica]|nr:hypothetical protein SUGI_0759380 [Cryptomeria japonica]
MYKRDAPKLNKSSFSTWQKRMKLHLLGIGEYVVYYLENDFVTPSTYPLTMEEIKAKQEHIQVAIEITSALTDLEFNDLEGCNDAKAMWDKLISVYGGDEHVQRAKVDSLRGQLESMRMNEGENITQYSTRLKEIVNQIKGVGGIIEEKDMTNATIGKIHAFELSNFDNSGSSVNKVESAFSSFHLDDSNDFNKRKYKYSEGDHSGASERFRKNMEEVHKLYEEIKKQEEFEALLARRLPIGKGEIHKSIEEERTTMELHGRSIQFCIWSKTQKQGRAVHSGHFCACVKHFVPVLSILCLCMQHSALVSDILHLCHEFYSCVKSRIEDPIFPDTHNDSPILVHPIQSPIHTPFPEQDQDIPVHPIPNDPLPFHEKNVLSNPIGIPLPKKDQDIPSILYDDPIKSQDQSTFKEDSNDLPRQDQIISLNPPQDPFVPPSPCPNAPYTLQDRISFDDPIISSIPSLEEPIIEPCPLHNPSPPHDPNPTHDSNVSVQDVHEPSTCIMGSSTLVQSDPLQDLIISLISYPPHNGLASSSQRKEYPTSQDIHKGKGVDLHKKESLHVKQDLKVHVYTTHSQDIGIPLSKSEHIPSPSSLPSILGPYIPSSFMQGKQRHTSLRTFQSSKRTPLHSYPSMHSFPPPSNLDAKYKSHNSRNPHVFKDQHVQYNRHVKTKNNMIYKEKEKSKRPQRPTEQNKAKSKYIWVPKSLVQAMHSKEPQKHEKSKTMWIPKRLLEAQKPKETINLASKIAIPPSNPLKFVPPSPSSSILGPYVPKSIAIPSSKSQYPKYVFPPSVHHPSRCVPMLILPSFPSTEAQFFQYPIHYPMHIFHPSIPLVQSFA